MSDILSWKDLRDALRGHADDFHINEKVFAKLEGWSWPLFGASERLFSEDHGDHDYVGRVDVATNAVISSCKSICWDNEDAAEPKIDLLYRDGLWSAKVELSAELCDAASDGSCKTALAMVGQDAQPGAAIMKSFIEARNVLQMSKENTAAREAHAAGMDGP